MTAFGGALNEVLDAGKDREGALGWRGAWAFNDEVFWAKRLVSWVVDGLVSSVSDLSGKAG